MTKTEIEKFARQFKNAIQKSIDNNPHQSEQLVETSTIINTWDLFKIAFQNQDKIAASETQEQLIQHVRQSLDILKQMEEKNYYKNENIRTMPNKPPFITKIVKTVRALQARYHEVKIVNMKLEIKTANAKIVVDVNGDINNKSFPIVTIEPPLNPIKTEIEAITLIKTGNFELLVEEICEDVRYDSIPF